MALSPDYAGPLLAATLSFGVRTFLSLTSAKSVGGVGSDRLIYFSPETLDLFFNTSSIARLANRSANRLCSRVTWMIR